MRKLMTLAILLGAFATAEAANGNGVAANSIQASAANPRSGSFGLAVTLAGTPNLAYLQDDTPAGEHLVKLEVLLYLDTAGTFGAPFAMNVGDNFIILRGRAPLDPKAIWRVVLLRKPSGAYFLRMFAREETGFRSTGQVLVAANTWQRIGVEWGAATGSSANDGRVRLLKNLVSRGVDDLDNPFRVDRIQLGVLPGVDATTTGTFYLDDFSSFRTLAP